MSRAMVQFVVSRACEAAGNCVEVGLLPSGHVAVADSKDIGSTLLLFTPSEWDDFIAGAKAGEFDRTVLPTPAFA